MGAADYTEASLPDRAHQKGWNVPDEETGSMVCILPKPKPRGD